MLVTQTQIVIRVTKLRAVHVCRVSSTSGCSGVAQGLLLLYRHDHVDVNFIIGNTEHDADSKKLPDMVRPLQVALLFLFARPHGFIDMTFIGIIAVTPTHTPMPHLLSRVCAV